MKSLNNQNERLTQHAAGYEHHAPRRTRDAIRATLSLAAVLLAPGSFGQQGVINCGPTFTYQGRLTDSDVPFDASLDFQFKLFDSQFGGNQVGSTLTNLAITPSNGLFTTSLNFGYAPFSSGTNSAGWLEVSLRTNGVGTNFYVFDTRQQLTASPYSLYSATANLAENVRSNALTGAAFQDGSIPLPKISTAGALSGQVLGYNGTNALWMGVISNTNPPPSVTAGAGLTSSLSNGTVTLSIAGGGVGTAQIADGAVTGAKLASGAAVTGLNGLTGPVSVTNDDGSLAVVNIGAGIIIRQQCTPWCTLGNAGTDPTVNFVGTTDNKGLKLGVNTHQALLLTPNANPTVVGPGLTGGWEGNAISSGVAAGTIAGGGNSGGENKVTDDYGTVGGGVGNIAGNNNGTVADARYTTVGGGSTNVASLIGCTVSGGSQNSASNNYAVVAGGYGNYNIAVWGAIGGGTNNRTSGKAAVITGGGLNTNSGDFAVIGGGWRNTNFGISGVISGGTNNTLTGNVGVIGGGRRNSSTSLGTVIAGGDLNSIQSGADFATIGGGATNAVQTGVIGVTIGGGRLNIAQAPALDAVIGGGISNIIAGQAAVIGGGSNNYAGGLASVIGGGNLNIVYSGDATIAGGYDNLISANAEGSVIAGGSINFIQSQGYSDAIGGGVYNFCSNSFATIPGGYNNSAVGYSSFAAGQNAKANHDGSFVWADAAGPDFVSTARDQFSARATNGFRFVTGIDGSGNPVAGVKLGPGDQAWSSISDRNVKKNFQPVNGKEVLEKLSDVPVQRWNYKFEADTATPHIGPMAQDFKGAFFPGRDDKVITTLEFDGVELAAIQGLHQMVKEKETKIEELEKKNRRLEERLDALERHINGSWSK